MPAQTRARARAVNGQLVCDDEDMVDVARFKHVVDKFRLPDSPRERKTTQEGRIKFTTQNTPKMIASKRSADSQVAAPSLKRKRITSSYAPPSKYAHLNGLTDAIAHGLLVLLVGHNPGVATAKCGHAYAHPSNSFWKLLHASGLTDRCCLPQEDKDLPQLYSLGLTNLVARPSKDTAELSKAEQAAGTPILEEKVRTYKPEVVCLVGKSIWEAVWRWKHGRPMRKHEFKYGWQAVEHNLGLLATDLDATQTECGWKGARVFVATTTSGLAATLSLAEKKAIWKPLGDWVCERRIKPLVHHTDEISLNLQPV